ncbi:MAG: hypothetical protein DRJ32_04845 [Thermoprotei archaeon]|nr:MAG: hypothetical protein DRJ32_04845 [Thermoprotei archaeon]
MPRITPIDPYKLIKVLGKVGFKPVRWKGSLYPYVKDGEPCKNLTGWSLGDSFLYIFVDYRIPCGVRNGV